MNTARILIVPGWRNSEPAHWQSLWEARLPGARLGQRVEDAGHINVASGFGEWPFGLQLLSELGVEVDPAELLRRAA